MVSEKQIKSLVYNYLRIPPVNWAGKKIAARIPYQIFAKTNFTFPAKGELHISLPGNKQFWMISDGSDPIASRVALHGHLAFEPEMFELLHQLLPQKSHFADVGANSGIYSLYASQFENIKSVASFEPEPQTFEFLKQNREINQLNKIMLFNIALSSEPGEHTLHVPRSITLPTGSSLDEGHRQNTKEIVVRVDQMDKLIDCHELPAPDLIKIDTEKTEPKVLKGAMKILSNHQPDVICEVLTNKVGEQLQKLFYQLEYDFYHIGEKGLTKVNKVEADFSYQFKNYIFSKDDLALKWKLKRH